HPLTGKIVDGDRVYPVTKARDLFALIYEVAARAPDDLTLGAQLLNLPPAEGHQAGPMAVLNVTYLGKPDDLDRLLAPFKVLGSPVEDRIQAKTYLEAQGAAGTAPIAVPGSQSGTPMYIKTGFLHSTSTAFVDELVRTSPRPSRSWESGRCAIRSAVR